MNRKHGHIPGLDGLRALSIILVLIGHSYATMPGHTWVSNQWNLFIGNGELGVITFFGISGYLITRLLRNEQERNGAIYLRGFYSRRVLRIFPAFYSYLTVILILAGLGMINTAFKSIFWAATFSVNYHYFFHLGREAEKGIWFVGHFWSLSLEEQFYLLWPLTLVLAGLKKARRAAVVMLFVGPLLRVAVYFFWPEARTQTGAMLPTAADAMMAGAALALYEGKAGFEAFLGRFSLDLAALIAAITAFLISPLLNAKFAGAYELPVGRTITAVSIAIIILYATRRPETLVGRMLNSRVMAFIGVLSYSLYVWQQLFLTSLNTTWTGKYPVNLAVCFAVATISYYFIERPFLRLKDRIPKRKGGRLENTAGGLPEPVATALRSKKREMIS